MPNCFRQMDFTMTEMMAERRLSLDSDYGLSSTTSTIDPNDSIYSHCSSCISLESEDEDDVFVQSLVMRTESLESLTDTMAANGVSEILAFKNTDALSEDLQCVNGIPEMCDVKFLVGPEKVPVYGVKAILCARSRVLYSKILLAEKLAKRSKHGPKRKRRSIFAFLRGKRNKKSSQTLPEAETSEGNLLTVDIPETDPGIFKKLVLFLHSGTVTVDISNVIGMLSASEEYGLDELARACHQFATRFISDRAVLPLLESIHLYQKTDLTWTITQQAFEFIDKSTQTVLEHDEFAAVSQHLAVMILSRPTLRMSEEAKWDAALRWSRRQSGNDVIHLRSYLKLFTPSINLLQIPLTKLMSEVTPLCSASSETLFASDTWISESWMEAPPPTDKVTRRTSGHRKDSVSSACSRMTSRSADSGYISYFRESCLL